MSRPFKTGLDYFPHDMDAANDDKLEALRALYGNDGYAFYFILLERIYHSENAELDISDEDAIQILCKKLLLTRERFAEILATALKWGCFDEQACTERRVLTSNRIKKCAEIVFEERRIKQLKYQKSRIERVSVAVSPGETTGETPVSPPISPPVSLVDFSCGVSLSRESKENKIKENKSREKESKANNNLCPDNYPAENGAMREKPVFSRVSASEIVDANGEIYEITSEAREIWRKSLSLLRPQVNAANYRTWLEKTTGLARKGNDFLISVPDGFIADYLNQHLRSLIEKTLIQLTLKKYKVSFLVDNQSPQTVPAKPP